jgi:hypothetical protein
MAQLFPRWADTAVRAVLIGAGVLVVAVPLGLLTFARTPVATRQYAPVSQPVAFSHPLHVNGFRIDCRYCHAGVERGPMAGLPPTSACVPCHDEGWLRSSLLAPVMRSVATRRPIPWRRVTAVPDFVFFNHAVHVRKGVGCETCHGRVDLMQQVYQTAPLTMGWCVNCHREPERFLRPVEQVTAMGWSPGGSPRSGRARSGWGPQLAQGRALAARYHVRRLTTCTACHR